MPPRRQGRDLGQAGGLQLGNRVRGNQDPQARVPRARRSRQGLRHFVSIGGVQSTHTRQVPGVAAHLGLKSVTVQEAWVDWPDVVYDKSQHPAVADHGCDVRLDSAGFDIGIRDSWQRALESVVEAEESRTDPAEPFRPPLGGSVRQLGSRGRDAGIEHNICFDHVVFCTVTGSTHAGMIAGFALEARNDRPYRNRRSATIGQGAAQVARIARSTAEMIGLGRDLTDTRSRSSTATSWHVRDPRCADDRRDQRRAPVEGMLTDPIYEGKSMAGLIGEAAPRDPADRGAVRPSRRQPCLPAYAGVLCSIRSEGIVVGQLQPGRFRGGPPKGDSHRGVLWHRSSRCPTNEGPPTCNGRGSCLIMAILTW